MRKFFLFSLIALWALGGSYYLTKMHGWHYANLQNPNELKFRPENEGKWGVYHFFDARCSCSQTILEGLLNRKPFNSSFVKEIVFYAHDLGDKKVELIEKGYELQKVNFKELGITGVPLLVIFDTNKITRYVGGYSNKVINPLAVPDDKSLITQVIEGKEIKNKPVIGCSVSKEYQKILDPLGLKYGRVIN